MTGEVRVAAAVASVAVLLLASPVAAGAPGRRAHEPDAEIGRPGAAAPAGESRAEELRRLRLARVGSGAPRYPGRLERLVARYEDMTLPDRQLVAAFGVPVRRFRPKLGGLGTGSGLTLGIAHDWLRHGHGRLDASAQVMYSISGYRALLLRAELPRLLTRRLALGAEMRYVDRPRERFFGFGNESREADETTYRLEESGLFLTMRFTPGRYSWLVLGAGLAYVDPDLGDGRRKGVPPTDDVFDAGALPGLDAQASGLRQQLSIEVDRRDQGYAQAGFLYRASVTRFDDVELDRFDFRRLELEMSHYLPIVRRYRTVALRLLASFDAEREGHRVPFYQQLTLGSGNDLRGFANFRFRDDNRLLLSGEYRWRLATTLDAAVFVDAGKVFPRRSQLGLKGLHAGYGIGLRLHTTERVRLRLDLARSAERLAFHVKLHHVF